MKYFNLFLACVSFMAFLASLYMGLSSATIAINLLATVLNLGLFYTIYAG